MTPCPGVYVRATPDTIHTLHVFLLARATYAEFGSLVADLRQPVSVSDVQTRA